MSDVPDSSQGGPTFAEALRFWIKLGFISFGGPTGQIAIMHTELVDRRRWVNEPQFLHALNFCMLLPGPEAQQLATYIGWLLHGTRGALAAGTLFVLPSVLILWVLSYVYVRHGTTSGVAAVFYGLKPAVLAIVVHALVRIARRALKTRLQWILAILAFVSIFFLRAPFPFIIAAAAVAGAVFHAAGARIPLGSPSHGPLAHPPNGEKYMESPPAQGYPTLRRTVRICALFLCLWFLPILLLGLVLGRDHAVVQQGIFFSKAAVVTFGGAYAVLPYVAQQAVEQYQWLSAPQMLDGLGLAETTPGPLIMVVQFVAFLGGWNQPGRLTPLEAATIGAMLTNWVTFVPCFFWVFLGAPFVQTLRKKARLSAALAGITAAVVGVVLNLALWFGLRVLFPSVGSVDVFVCAVTVVAFALLMRGWSVVTVVLGGGAAGLVYSLT